ncbi:MAG: BamA/TamA family outer membrane protein [Flavobacteriales bacterium]|nr:BamA/TamA family outer membrane protein [Flavobacteriales bacterium]
MRKVLLLLPLALWISLSSIAQVPLGENSVSYRHGAEYEIAEITVSSNSDKIDKNYVIFISGLVRGERVEMPGTVFTNAIKKLWAEKVFSDIKITLTKIIDDKIFVNIHVEERPRLSRFTFKGINKTESDNIRDIIKLFRGEVVTPNLLLSTKAKIKDYYDDKGFLLADINLVEIADTTAGTPTVTLEIKIDKGQKVKIGDIIITGNDQVEDYELKRALKNTKRKSDFQIHNDLWKLISRPRASFAAIKKEDDKYDFYPLLIKYFRQRANINILKSSKFVEPDYETDKDALIALYNREGYRDARILSDSIGYVNGDMIIYINVEEGSRYFIRNVNWIGNSKYKTEDLNKILDMKRGDVYNREKLDMALNYNPAGMDISTLYQDNGYLFFNITPVETAIEGDSVDIEFRVYEGKQAIINRVSVTGNTKTSDHVIIREIRSKPGQLFSRSDIIRTQQELGTLGYFNPQAMNVIPKPNPQDGTVDLEFVVEEQPNDQVELSGGYGNRTIVGTLGVTFNNFSTRNIFNKKAWKPLPAGDGQRLSIRAQSNGQFFQSYNFSFTEPWLGGKKPIAFSISAYHSQNNLGLTTSNNGRIQSSSVMMSVGKRLKWPDDFFNIFTFVKWERYNLRNYAISNDFDNGTSHKIAFQISLSRNSTDDFIFPTRGSNISVSSEFTPPFSYLIEKDYANLPAEERNRLLEYHKWKFNAQFFTGIGGQKLSKKLVLFNRFDFGALGGYNPNIPLTPFERFQVGGDGLSALGFQNQFLGREVIALRGYQNGALTPGFPGNPYGGTVYTKITTELRYLISGNPSAKIFVLAFMEAGNSWENFKDFSSFRVNRSAGGGVRIFLPMFGLLGVDYGWGFDPVRGTPEDKRQKGNFHFMIGQQF